MKAINQILKNHLFLECLKKTNEAEDTRVFCCHGIDHLLAVARIGYLYILENHLSIKKEMIYTVALLHDIGKWVQYQDGTPHEIASVALAKTILKESDFSQQNQEIIISAIQTHRTYQYEDHSLNYILWYADKQSRNCFLCPMNSQCKWTESEKNKTILR